MMPHPSRVRRAKSTPHSNDQDSYTPEEYAGDDDARCSKSIRPRLLLQLTFLGLVFYFVIVGFRLDLVLLGQHSAASALSSLKGNRTQQHPPEQHQHQDDSLKIAIYMTTHMDERQVQFLEQCWPAANEHLPLVRMADLIVYTSCTTQQPPDNKIYCDEAFFRSMGFYNKIVIHHYQELYGPPQQYSDQNASKEFLLQKQDGAVRAMVEPFLSATSISSHDKGAKNHSAWFDGYDWVIRLNPDVLIRRDTWLLRQLHNTSVDGIFVDWRYHFGSGRFKGNRVHTDFFAFRPTAVNGVALVESYQQQQAEEYMYRQTQEQDTIRQRYKRQQQRPQVPQSSPEHDQQLREQLHERLRQRQSTNIHAESHIWHGFGHLVEQGRVAWLPNVKLYSGAARVTGPDCDVVHEHDFLKHCPYYFNASDTELGHYR